jgi:hypothetical protein
MDAKHPTAAKRGGRHHPMLCASTHHHQQHPVRFVSERTCRGDSKASRCRWRLAVAVAMAMAVESPLPGPPVPRGAACRQVFSSAELELESSVTRLAPACAPQVSFDDSPPVTLTSTGELRRRSRASSCTGSMGPCLNVTLLARLYRGRQPDRSVRITASIHQGIMGWMDP